MPPKVAGEFNHTESLAKRFAKAETDIYLCEDESSSWPTPPPMIPR